ncbi:hypothetical protein WKI65_44175 [Streptomyces sp. MS1.AVA.3]|uniref:hypothetical protein n=1 Tax=Streptomyces decoyicus TaxID=249567 RepID=UPI0030BEE018
MNSSVESVVQDLIKASTTAAGKQIYTVEVVTYVVQELRLLQEKVSGLEAKVKELEARPAPSS